uniref:Uncharacterized protein n=1 Tax=Arundo donax TaxID=35708 RepID=A0A0A9EEI6_ARUDO
MFTVLHISYSSVLALLMFQLNVKLDLWKYDLKAISSYIMHWMDTTKAENLEIKLTPSNSTLVE